MTYVTRVSVTVIGVLFPVLTFVFLGLRFSRNLHIRTIEIDDILIIPAAFATAAIGIGLVTGAKLDIVGQHSLPVITPSQNERLFKFVYAFSIAQVLAIGLIKLSILFQLRRIFKGRAFTTTFDYCNWILIVAVILWTVVFLFFEIFLCGTRPSLTWSDPHSSRHLCINPFALQTSSAVFNWVMDLAIVIEPLFVIQSLNMGLQRKIQTSLVFLFSFFATVAGLLSMVVWIQILTQDIEHPITNILAEKFDTADIMGVVSIVLFWTYIEVGVGFIVACLPRCVSVFDTFLHYFVRYFRSLTIFRVFSSRVGEFARGRNSNSTGDLSSCRRWRYQKSSTARQSAGELELVERGREALL